MAKTLTIRGQREREGRREIVLSTVLELSRAKITPLLHRQTSAGEKEEYSVQSLIAKYYCAPSGEYIEIGYICVDRKASNDWHNQRYCRLADETYFHLCPGMDACKCTERIPYIPGGKEFL